EMWKNTYFDKKLGKQREGLKWPLNSKDYKAKNNRSIYHLYPPSQIRIEPDNTFSINGNKPSSGKVDLECFNKYCKYIKETQFKKGLISTGDSAYIALFLLRNNPKICKWLSVRFPYIVIDEAQDNSILQHAIFEELNKQGLNNIELIGDPYQSLYEWRDATPSEFLRKYYQDGSWQSFDLTDNRRSPQNIIDIFSLVRDKKDPKINSLDCPEVDDSILIYQYSDKNHQSIIKHYDSVCSGKNYLNSCIVARGNSLKDSLLGKKAEQRPWGIMLPKTIISAKNLYLSGDIKNAMKEIRSTCVSLIHNEVSDYHTIKELEKAKSEDHAFNSLMMCVLDEIPSLKKTIQEWTTDTEKFLREKLQLSYDIDFKLRNRNSTYFDKATLSDTVETHFKKSFSSY